MDLLFFCGHWVHSVVGFLSISLCVWAEGVVWPKGLGDQAIGSCLLDT